MREMRAVIVFVALVVNSDAGIHVQQIMNGHRSREADRMKGIMDPSANPCDDFYQYACGRWHQFEPIPEGSRRFNIKTVMQITESVKLNALFKSNLTETTQYSEDNAILKARNLYKSCVNITEIDRKAAGPLIEFLRNLGGWPAMEKNWTNSGHNWTVALARARQLDERILFDSYVYEDITRSSVYILYIDEPYFGLGPTPGNRDFFLNATKELEAYRTLISDVLKALGNEDHAVDSEVEDIINFETALANISSPLADRKNLTRRYTRMTIDVLIRNFPNIEWLQYFSLVHDRKMTTSEPIVMMAKKFVAHLSDLIGRTDPRTITNYIHWRMVQKLAPHLGTVFEEIFKKYNVAMLGKETTLLRWQKCLWNTVEHMGMATGALYVKKDFKISTKIKINNMFGYLKDVFRNILKRKDWLDSSARIFAKEKLQGMKIEIGYPDFILNTDELNKYYKDIKINEADYFGNMLSVYQSKSIQQTEKIGRKVNKNEWSLHPVETRVLYDYLKQRIFVTAAILNSPFFHDHFPYFLNFARIGSVIAHDMSHAFDEIGAMFDSTGNLQNWWSISTAESYNTAANCIEKQYDNYVINGMKVSGKKIYREAVADNAGLKVAFLAYKKWLENKTNDPIVKNEYLPGFNMTKEQLFFLGFAQNYCEYIRDDAVHHILETETHPIGKHRVNATLSNFDDFAKAFNCPERQSKNKCYIW